MSALRDRLDLESMPEPNTGCTLWFGCWNRSGYGWVRWDGRPQLAHRLSYEDAKGPIPAGLHLLHRCDVPCCINPDHLKPGTQADNNADMRSKGRSSDGRPRPAVRGERNGHSKYSEALMLQVKDAPGTHKDIARRYGVPKTTVGYVKRGIQWGHLS